MIAIASDHAGYEYKEKIKSLLKELGHDYCDLGPSTTDTVDYPDYAAAAAQAVSGGKCNLGILVCGTGIGMSIAANKHRGIRAAVCESVTTARLARAHNDANILALGGRVVGWEVAMDVVKTFLSTSFDGGDRHQRRIIKIDAPLNPSL
jgi:ribose 5-phosphate isomerase B